MQDRIDPVQAPDSHVRLRLRLQRDAIDLLGRALHGTTEDAAEPEDGAAHRFVPNRSADVAAEVERVG